MEIWIYRFKAFAIEFLARNHALFLLDLDYYSGLWDKYFSLGGFVAGLIFITLVFFAGESKRKAGFFKMVPFIAVINSCSAIINYVYRFINGYGMERIAFFGTDYVLSWTIPSSAVTALFSGADNILSGFLLTLTVVSCFQGSGGRAFLFGTATFAALPLMNYSVVMNQMSGTQLAILAIRIFMIGVLCSIMSHQRYFYASWLYYGGCYILLKLIMILLPPILASRSLSLVGLSVLGGYLWQFLPEYIVFVAILLFAVLFEQLVLAKENAKGKKASAGPA